MAKFPSTFINKLTSVTVDTDINVVSNVEAISGKKEVILGDQIKQVLTLRTVPLSELEDREFQVFLKKIKNYGLIEMDLNSIATFRPANPSVQGISLLNDVQIGGKILNVTSRIQDASYPLEIGSYLQINNNQGHYKLYQIIDETGGIPAWDELKEYTEDEVILYSGRIYTARESNLAKQISYTFTIGTGADQVGQLQVISKDADNNDVVLSTISIPVLSTGKTVQYPFVLGGPTVRLGTSSVNGSVEVVNQVTGTVQDTIILPEDIKKVQTLTFDLAGGTALAGNGFIPFLKENGGTANISIPGTVAARETLSYSGGNSGANWFFELGDGTERNIRLDYANTQDKIADALRAADFIDSVTNTFNTTTITYNPAFGNVTYVRREGGSGSNPSRYNHRDFSQADFTIEEIATALASHGLIFDAQVTSPTTIDATINSFEFDTTGFMTTGSRLGRQNDTITSIVTKTAYSARASNETNIASVLSANTLIDNVSFIDDSSGNRLMVVNFSTDAGNADLFNFMPTFNNQTLDDTASITTRAFTPAQFSDTTTFVDYLNTLANDGSIPAIDEVSLTSTTNEILVKFFIDFGDARLILTPTKAGQSLVAGAIQDFVPLNLDRRPADDAGNINSNFWIQQSEDVTVNRQYTISPGLENAYSSGTEINYNNLVGQFRADNGEFAATEAGNTADRGTLKTYRFRLTEEL